MRVPVMLQAERSECSLACLVMVLAAYGDRRGMAALRKEWPCSGRGAVLEQLLDTARAAGLNARPLQIDLDELAALRAPAILHWSFNHFVVLVAADRRYAVIHDPASGRRRLSWQEVSRCYTGVAIELWPDRGFQRQPAPKAIDWRQLLRPVAGLFSGIGRIAVLALVLELLVLGGPLFMKGVVDHVLVSSNAGLMTVLGIGFMALLVFQVGTVALRAWSMTTFAQGLGFAWQGRLFRHLLALPVEYFTRRSLGDVLSRFDSLQTIQRALSSSLLEALFDGGMAILTLALMCWISPALAAISLSAVAINLAVQSAMLGRSQEHNERVIQAAARQQGHAIESVRGVVTLRVADAERTRHAAWQDLFAHSLNEQLALARLTLGLRGLGQWLVGAERIAVVWMAALMVLDQRFSIGLLIAYLAYRDLFAGRAGTLVDRVMELRMLRLHAMRLGDITDTSPEPEAVDPGWRRIEHVEIRAASFRHASQDPPVLDGLDLELHAGEVVAVVGASGCGKSTLLKVLLGLLPLGSGSIKVNHQDIRGGEFVALRRRCGVVLQDDQLFAGSIAENIAGFDPSCAQDQIVEAARMAAIHDDIVAMPMAYRTTVGDMGSSLSGGQKQRILLARALCRRPEVLLLDEATSHLDVRSERLVNDAVRALSAVVLVIAHRPETIAAADRVLVMEHGRIVRIYRPHRAEQSDSTAPADQVTAPAAVPAA